MSIPRNLRAHRMRGPIGMDPVDHHRDPHPLTQPRGIFQEVAEFAEDFVDATRCAISTVNLEHLRREIVRISFEEWEKWHPIRTSGRRAGRRRNYKETSRAMRDILTDYWLTGASMNLHHSRFDDQAWSSAFICWVMRQAGAGDRWVYTRRHSEYIHAAIHNREDGNDNPFRAYPVDEATIEVGDIVCANRGSGITYDRARNRTKYKSHSDFVVSRDGDRIVTIGGNVGDTVKKKNVRLTPEGHLRPRRYFAVIKIEDPACLPDDADDA